MGNGITDEGAGYLAEMLKINSTLDTIDLDLNNISDQGVELLANTLCVNNNTLVRISLNGNKLVSDKSVDFIIMMLKQNSTLSFLDIYKCNLSEDGKKRLQQMEQTKQFFCLSV